VTASALQEGRRWVKLGVNSPERGSGGKPGRKTIMVGKKKPALRKKGKLSTRQTHNNTLREREEIDVVG